jgi:hypothetical protein
MSDSGLNDILKKAADAVSDLPEHLQGVAFSEAVRILEAEGSGKKPRSRKRTAPGGSKGRSKKSSSEGSAKRKRSRLPGPSLDRDLNLRPSGHTSMTDFYAEKSPNGQDEHNVLFVYYLERSLGLAVVTVNQVYTCYKEVKAKVPSNLRNSLQVTATRKGWIDTENSEDLKVTTRGENLVEQDLPRADGKK